MNITQYLFYLLISLTFIGCLPEPNHNIENFETSSEALAKKLRDPAILSISGASSFQFKASLQKDIIKETLTLSNTGTSSATAVSFGALSAPFAIESNSCPSRIRPSQSCFFVISYNPATQLESVNEQSLAVNYYDGFKSSSTVKYISGVLATEPVVTEPAPAPVAEPTPTPLTITSITSANTTENSTVISWQLSDYATGQIEYGTTTSYGALSTKEESFTYNKHIQTLSNLQAGTTYHYRVISTNANGSTVISADQTFKTLAPPLTITSVGSASTTENSTVISWQLSDYATGQIEYGTTTSYGSFSIKENSFTYNSHTQTLSNLNPDTTYHYRVISTDANGNTAISQDQTFKTLATTEPVVAEPTPTPYIPTEISWVELNGKVYGAKPDSRGPIGGGSSYFDIKTSGKYVVTTYNELKSAVSSAVAGDVIYIPGDSVINFDGQPTIDIRTANITIASNRGYNGSTGALLKRDQLVHNTYMFFVNADNVRLTGLNIQGAYGEAASISQNTFGIRLYKKNTEIDNCEIHNFSYAGVYLSLSSTATIHHNFIHHNQRSGYGYGVVTYNSSEATIEYNQFEYSRHHIAGSGELGQKYHARHNIILKGGSTDAGFDMHGDITINPNGGPAGTLINIHNNTWYSGYGVASGINIRGEPREAAYITYNYFPGFDREDRILWHLYSPGENIYDSENIFGDGYTPATSSVEASWLEQNGKVYGAKPDSRGAIGGGAGYFDIKTSGKYTATTYSELKNAISSASSGDVIYIPEGSVINFDGQPQIIITTPNITIASNRGHNGSTGALLKRDILVHNSYLFDVKADNVRFTGLRIQGPHGTTDYVGKTVHGIRIYNTGAEVDNNEIYNFPVSGVNPRLGHANIHHNYIHHNCQSGLGYGITLVEGTALIEYNKFEFNRHHIAGGGAEGSGYTARHNVEVGTQTAGVSFDMHGDGGNGNPAGNVIEIYNNTFYARTYSAVQIRGNPREKGEIYRNRFIKYKNASDAVDITYTTGEAVTIWDNLYGN